MALRHLGEAVAADAVVRAVAVVGERHGQGRGPGTPAPIRTTDVTDAVIAELEEPPTA
jgi:isocitrate/isopropylmalate dehydrogenase